MDKDTKIDLIKLIKPLKTDLTGKEVEILTALADNTGYAEYELARMIGSDETYTNNLLKELFKYKFGSLIDSYSIQSFHIIEPLLLLHKIQDQRDHLSRHIFKQSPLIQDRNLATADIDSIGFYLALSLDGILIDSELYDLERFRGVKLSADAKDLLAKSNDLKKGSIRILNRILIEDAYPEICKSRFSLIYRLLRPNSKESKFPYFLNLNLCTFYYILEHLVMELNLKKSKLDVLEARLKSQLSIYNGFEDFFIDRSRVEKTIKSGKYDLLYFKKEYEQSSEVLMKFLTSNYIGALIKKYGCKPILKSLIPIREFDLVKFINFCTKNECISKEEVDQLEFDLTQKMIESGAITEYDLNILKEISSGENVPDKQ